MAKKVKSKSVKKVNKVAKPKAVKKATPKPAAKKVSTPQTPEEVIKARIERLEKRVTDLSNAYKKDISQTRTSLTSERVALRKKVSKEISEVKKKLRATTSNSHTITTLENKFAELSKKVYSEPAKTTRMVDISGTKTAANTALAPIAARPLSMSEEELASDIVSLYFEEIARHGFKRTLTLDDIIKTFSYTLKEIRKELGTNMPAPEPVRMQETAPVETIVEDSGHQITGFSYTNSRGQLYHLHSRGKLFYFSKKAEGSIPLPEGMTVVENARTGLPMVKRKK